MFSTHCGPRLPLPLCTHACVSIQVGSLTQSNEAYEWVKQRAVALRAEGDAAANAAAKVCVCFFFDFSAFEARAADHLLPLLVVLDCPWFLYFRNEIILLHCPSL